MNKLSFYIGKAGINSPLTLHFHSSNVTETFTNICKLASRKYTLDCVRSNGTQGTYGRNELVSEVESMDMSPTWRSIIDIHAQAYATGSESAQREIHRCANLADCTVEILKIAKGQKGDVIIPRNEFDRIMITLCAGKQ